MIILPYGGGVFGKSHFFEARRRRAAARRSGYGLPGRMPGQPGSLGQGRRGGGRLEDGRRRGEQVCEGSTHGRRSHRGGLNEMFGIFEMFEIFAEIPEDS